MKFAYADPPYYGCCKLYGHRHEAPYGCWDQLSTHRQLIEQLQAEFPDGWALSSSAPAARRLERAGLFPDDARYGAWVKPFAAFKRNVRNAYTWEPVILRGGRLSSKDGAPVARDHITTTDEEWPALRESITLRKGFTGAKPERFCRWVLDMLGFIDGEDQLVDLFPGTNVMQGVLDAPRMAV